MKDDLPMEEIRRRHSWVDFLAPLSEHELDDLLRGASFLEIEKINERVERTNHGDKRHRAASQARSPERRAGR
jgi:hypothetical protein